MDDLVHRTWDAAADHASCSAGVAAAAAAAVADDEEDAPADTRVAEAADDHQWECERE